jgi:queuine tRNA-ribosyltransferase
VGLQFQLGSDIVVCLDDCTDSEAPLAEQERSVERTVKWARRCREEFDRRLSVRGRRGADPVHPPRIFAVVQGGGVEALRRQCATELAEIGFDGYGFGGWPLAADGSLLTDALRWVAEGLPEDAPKHALGIGRPDHVVSAFALGYSIFDCALPTRDARHGRLYAFRSGWGSRRPAPGDDFYRAVRIHDPDYRVLHAPVEEGCDCLLCSRYSAAYLHHLFKVGDTSAERLATLHNLRFYVRLFDLLRRASSPTPPARGAATGQKSV